MTFEKLIKVMEASLKDKDKIKLFPDSLQKYVVFKDEKESLVIELLIRHFACYIDEELRIEE